MSRVEPQLREYFDAGVERITVEDVIAQAQVQQNRLEPLRQRRSFKPAWAAVGAFAVTILGLGGLAAGLKLTERITGEFAGCVGFVAVTHPCGPKGTCPRTSSRAPRDFLSPTHGWSMVS